MAEENDDVSLGEVQVHITVVDELKEKVGDLQETPSVEEMSARDLPTQTAVEPTAGPLPQREEEEKFVERVRERALDESDIIGLFRTQRELSADPSTSVPATDLMQALQRMAGLIGVDDEPAKNTLMEQMEEAKNKFLEALEEKIATLKVDMEAYLEEVRRVRQEIADIRAHTTQIVATVLDRAQKVSDEIVATVSAIPQPFISGEEPKITPQAPPEPERMEPSKPSEDAERARIFSEIKTLIEQRRIQERAAPEGGVSREPFKTPSIETISEPSRREQADVPAQVTVRTVRGERSSDVGLQGLRQPRLEEFFPQMNEQKKKLEEVENSVRNTYRIVVNIENIMKDPGDPTKRETFQKAWKDAPTFGV